MSLSRVESRKRQQQNEQGRRNNRRLFAIILLFLVASIAIVLAVISQGERITGWVTGLINKPVEERNIYTVPTTTPSSNMASDQSDVEPEEALAPEQDEAELDASYELEEPVEQAVDTIEDTTDEGEGIDGQPSDSTGTDGDQTVQLAFVGDLLPGEYIATYLTNEGVSYPYEKALFHLTSADITAGNLELPITSADNPAENKTFVFKGKPESLSGLVDAGFDVVSLANNHTMDHGVEGLLETIKHLDEYGIGHVGAGNNAEEAYAPVIREVNGIKVAYVATSRVLPVTEWKATRYAPGLAESYDPTQTLKSIEALEEEADITVVLVHWGIERADKPEDYQLNLAKQYIDAGADLVIGSHPHVLQGFQQYNGKWIAYSLGNFVFNANPKERQAETGVLTATCNANSDCELQLAPMKVVNAQPTPIEGSEAEKLLGFLEQVSIGNVMIDARGNITNRD